MTITDPTRCPARHEHGRCNRPDDGHERHRARTDYGQVEWERDEPTTPAPEGSYEPQQDDSLTMLTKDLDRMTAERDEAKANHEEAFRVVMEEFRDHRQTLIQLRVLSAEITRIAEWAYESADEAPQPPGNLTTDEVAVVFRAIGHRLHHALAQQPTPPPVEAVGGPDGTGTGRAQGAAQRGPQGADGAS